MSTLQLVIGPNNGALARTLSETAGLPLVAAQVEAFPDGEQRVLLEGSVRDKRLALVHTLGAPCGQRLLELSLFADAARRGGARELVAVIPYFGYARQDRREHDAEALGAAVMASLLSSCHFERILGVDLHSAALEGFFRCPVDNLTAEPLLVSALVHHADDGVIVAPDLGAAKLGRRYAQRLGLPLAIVHKTRLSAREVAVGHIVGDVAGRRPILVDDMISTGGTIAAAYDAVVADGARPDAVVVASHGVFAGGWEDLLSTRGIRQVLVTDSVDPLVAPRGLRVQHVSLAPLLIEAMRRLEATRP